MVGMQEDFSSEISWCGNNSFPCWRLEQRRRSSSTSERDDILLVFMPERNTHFLSCALDVSHQRKCKLNYSELFYKEYKIQNAYSYPLKYLGMDVVHFKTYTDAA
jgi:hypothetical protein